MSKKHRHKHDFSKDQGCCNIVTPEEVIILIAVILIFGRNNYNYEHIYYMEQRRKKENINKCTFEEPELSAKSGFSIDNIEVENINFVKDTKYESKQSLEKEKTSPDNSVVINSKVKVYSTKAIENNFIDNTKQYLSPGSSVAKVPVIIAKPKLKIMLEALVNFPEPVFRIVDIDKTITLTEWKLVEGSDRLFIKGFINEKIVYAPAECAEDKINSGSIKEIALDVPFQCAAKVFGNVPPQDLEANSVIELENGYCKNNMDFYEINNSTCEALMENILAEVDSVKIFETDIQEEITLLDNSSCKAYTFEKIRKKAVLELELSLLQNQIVFSAYEGEE